MRETKAGGAARRRKMPLKQVRRNTCRSRTTFLISGAMAINHDLTFFNRCMEVTAVLVAPAKHRQELDWTQKA